MGESDEKAVRSETMAPPSAIYEAVNDYLDHAMLVEGKSPATICGYRSDLQNLVADMVGWEDVTLSPVCHHD